MVNSTCVIRVFGIIRSNIIAFGKSNLSGILSDRNGFMFFQNVLLAFIDLSYVCHRGTSVKKFALNFFLFSNMTVRLGLVLNDWKSRYINLSRRWMKKKKIHPKSSGHPKVKGIPS